MTLSERFSKLRDLEGSQTNLAEKTGLTVALISRIIKSESATVRSDTLEAIARTYPNLNTRWLLTGEGHMWQEEEEENSEEETKEALKQQVQEQTAMLNRVNELLEQRVKSLEALIKARDPGLAKEIGISENND